MSSTTETSGDPEGQPDNNVLAVEFDVHPDGDVSLRSITSESDTAVEATPTEENAPEETITIEDLRAHLEDRKAERAARERTAERLAWMTAPATYTVGDYVTFVLLANVTATVRIVELAADGTTSYAFSDGQVRAYRDHKVLTLWRPATPAEIELYEAHAVDRLGERIVLPVGE